MIYLDGNLHQMKLICFTMKSVFLMFLNMFRNPESLKICKTIIFFFVGFSKMFKLWFSYNVAIFESQTYCRHENINSSKGHKSCMRGEITPIILHPNLKRSCLFCRLNKLIIKHLYIWLYLSYNTLPTYVFQ